jgi:hypothetical protein
MEREEFVNVAEEALDSLPEEFRSRIQNVAILVEDFPSNQSTLQPGQRKRLLLGILHISFEFSVGSDLLDDDSTNSTVSDFHRTCLPILNVFGIAVILIRRFSQMINSISTSG